MSENEEAGGLPVDKGGGLPADRGGLSAGRGSLSAGRGGLPADREGGSPVDREEGVSAAADREDSFSANRGRGLPMSRGGSFSADRARAFSSGRGGAFSAGRGGAFSAGRGGSEISPALIQAVTQIQRLATTAPATEGYHVATQSLASNHSVLVTEAASSTSSVKPSPPCFSSPTVMADPSTTGEDASTSPDGLVTLVSPAVGTAASYHLPVYPRPVPAAELVSPTSTGVQGEEGMTPTNLVTHREHVPIWEPTNLVKTKLEPGELPKSSTGNQLVIKVQSESMKDLSRRTSIMQQLKNKLGSNIVVHMETPQGTVLIEGTQGVGSGHPGSSMSPDGLQRAEQVSSGDLGGGGEVVISMGAEDVGAGGQPGLVEVEETVRSQDLGGSMNGDGEADEIVNSVVSTIRTLSAKLGKEEYKECPICRDRVTGFHYGVQTCESCKGFFKRTVQNKKIFSCHRNGDCDVLLTTRKKCPGCRFQKCIDIGMKIEGIRNDRSRGGRSSYDGASIPTRRRSGSYTNIAVRPPKKRLSYSGIHPAQSQPPSDGIPVGGAGGGLGSFGASEPQLYRTPYSQPVIPQLIQDIFALENLYEEPNEKPQQCCIQRLTNGDYHKFNSMLHITEHRLYQIVRWARNLPNFLNIHTDDQILLLQNSWAELVCLGAVWRSRSTPGTIQLSFGKTIDLRKAKEMEHEECITRMLRVCEHFNRLRVDKYEYVCLKVLTLMLPDIKSLKESSTIQEYQNQLVDALLIYTSSHFPDMPTKFGQMLIRLSEVQRLTAITRSQILQKHAAGEVCEYGLLMELLRGQGQAGGEAGSAFGLSPGGPLGAPAGQEAASIHSTTGGSGDVPPQGFLPTPGCVPPPGFVPPRSSSAAVDKDLTPLAAAGDAAVVAAHVAASMGVEMQWS